MNTKLKLKGSMTHRAFILVAMLIATTAASTRLRANVETTGTCGGAGITIPFTDVQSGNVFFCSIAEAYLSSLTNGTTATTYSPEDPVTREQMAAFITRTMDQSIRRSSQRAALGQWWTPASAAGLILTSVGSSPSQVASDGADIWVATTTTVSRVRASDGKLLGTWTGGNSVHGVLVARGRVFATGYNTGVLYQIDPTQPPGAMTTVTNLLGAGASGLTFDGSRVWTANLGNSGSVSIVSLDPVGVNTIDNGFVNPNGILYDGANIWVTDYGDNTLKRVGSNGNILQTIPVGNHPLAPVFDGTNIWVPNQFEHSVKVVRASSGNVLATLTGNGLASPTQAAFDGERVLVTNTGGDSVSIWRATDFAPLGSVSMGAGSLPSGACSDGLNFWISLFGSASLARF